MLYSLLDLRLKEHTLAFQPMPILYNLLSKKSIAHGYTKEVGTDLLI
jgi:hypothetical protein